MRDKGEKWLKAIQERLGNPVFSALGYEWAGKIIFVSKSASVEYICQLTTAGIREIGDKLNRKVLWHCLRKNPDALPNTERRKPEKDQQFGTIH